MNKEQASNVDEGLFLFYFVMNIVKNIQRVAGEELVWLKGQGSVH